MSESLAELARTVAEGKAWANMIGGNDHPAHDGQTLNAICPSDDKAFGTIPRSGLDEVDQAVKAARSTFETSAWSRMTATERGRRLSKLSELVKANHMGTDRT